MWYHKKLRFPGGRAKALTLSYDDDVEENIRFVQILDRYGLKATFNLNMGMFAREGEQTRRMSLAAAQELYKNTPHEIAVHTLTHMPLYSVPDNMATYEVIEDIHRAEQAFGGIVRGMAYPNNSFHAGTGDLLRACGIAYCRTTVATHKFNLPENWLYLNPTCHHDDRQLFELCDRFLEKEPRKDAQMFYLWGHTYEFDDHDNWDVIERFAEKMSGRDDIWYATNIEIYDYVQAYRSLIFSADGLVVYNPTVTEVFFELGEDHGPMFSVKPGETVRIKRDDNI